RLAASSSWSRTNSHAGSTPSGAGWLPPSKGRGLLVCERRDAVAEVVRASAGRNRLGLELHLRLQTLPGRLVEQALRAAEGLGGPLGELTREVVHRGAKLGVRHDARVQAPVRR